MFQSRRSFFGILLVHAAYSLLYNTLTGTEARVSAQERFPLSLGTSFTHLPLGVTIGCGWEERLAGETAWWCPWHAAATYGGLYSSNLIPSRRTEALFAKRSPDYFWVFCSITFTARALSSYLWGVGPGGKGVRRDGIRLWVRRV